MRGAIIASVDPDDLLVKSLEAGERIVWSDRPHRLAGCLRRALLARMSSGGAFVLGGLIVSIAAVAVVASARYSLAGSLPGTTDVSLLYQLVLGVACIPLGLEAIFFVQRLLRCLDDRYAVTDRGRGIAIADGAVLFFDLPPPEQVVTRTPGDVEHGDVELGELAVQELSRHGPRARRRVTFHDVSYPLIAVESIRSAARRPPFC